MAGACAAAVLYHCLQGVPRCVLQLVAVGCIFLASKQHEVSVLQHQQQWVQQNKVQQQYSINGIFRQHTSICTIQLQTGSATAG